MREATRALGGLYAILRLYRRNQGQPLPFAGLLGTWSSPAHFSVYMFFCTQNQAKPPLSLKQTGHPPTLFADSSVQALEAQNPQTSIEDSTRREQGNEQSQRPGQGHVGKPGKIRMESGKLPDEI